MPARPWSRRLVAVLVGGLAVAASACAGGAGPQAVGKLPGRHLVPVAPPPPPLSWSPCPGQPGLQCGSVLVPVDYAHPARGSLAVAVTQAPATDGPARGVLVFNPGGPGESGNQILPLVLDKLPPSVRRTFEIVSFDPRGTGASQPLQCGTSPAAVASLLPVPAADGRPLPGTSVFASMVRACRQRAPGLFPYLDTEDTARDLDRIRQALGVTTIDYYGLSYGTVLGTVYADLFPHRVGAFVLDGAVDVGADLVTQADEEAPAAEHALDDLLVSCSAQGSCPLGPDPVAAYRSLAAQLTRRPLPAPGGGDATAVTVGDLDTAALLTVSVPAFTQTFESAVVAAQRGDGAPLRTLALEFETDVDGSSLVDPQWAITCNDTAPHPGPIAAGDHARALAQRYPLLGAYAVEYTYGGCVAWPPARQPVSGLRPKNVPPILVVGNTGDPNTPLVGATHLAALLPGARLVTWQGGGHTWLLNGSTDPCVQQVVAGYLLGTLPPSRSVCR